MSLQPYQFEPNSGQIIQLASGQYVAQFSISTYPLQTLEYEDQGVNGEGMRVIIVKIEGGESGGLAYRNGETLPFTKTPTEIGVELVAEHGGKRKGSLSIISS